MTSVMLLDTSSLTYRAYFAVPSSITGPHGRPVNAVRGVLDMTTRLLVDRRPDEIVHCLDADWRPAPRVAAYDGYKAKRPDEPEELSWQFGLLDEVLDAFGLPRVWAPGWEADDAIGTLCARAADGDSVDVVTGDRDLLQLVRDAGSGAVIRVLFTIKGVRDLEEFDEAGVKRKYGVPAGRYVDYATLRGDPSDGLPGVVGVGEKTARDLVRRYGSLEAVLADDAAHSPRLGQNLRSAAGYLAAMKQVVPVRTDVALERADGTRDDDRLAALAAAHGIDGPVGRLREALDG